MLLIKIGGGETINWDYIAYDLVELSKKEKFIVIHGAGGIRDRVAKKLGSPTKIITSPSGISSVYTDKQALEVFLMVYAGLVNKQIVAKLQRYGLNAVGLSGVDGKLWQAKRKKELLVRERNKTKILRGSYTGRVEKINTGLLQLLLKNGYIPVICPPAIDYQNEIVNTDNDWAAAILAAALNIKKIVMLFEAPGMLKDYYDKKTVIHHVKKTELDNIMKFAQGRMKKKILGAKKAIEEGVEKIYWGDGRIKNPIKNVLKGKGTIIQ